MGVFQDSHLPLNSYKLNIDNSKRNLVTSGMVCALFGPRQMLLSYGDERWKDGVV
jgi:hypothetical protein